ncbi:MAG: hypothetical protein H6710_13650 [Myxococcales bacterium]|nr:hypothetical protein [Myxococcales bacterium]MCB9704956.1 hypothetical protein [Myxococcales bacterium]
MPVSLKCPNCGAGLTAPAGAARMTCEYCGNQINLQGPPSGQPPRPEARPQGQLLIPPQQASDAARRVVISLAVGMAVLGVVSSLVIFLVTRSITSSVESAVGAANPGVAVPAIPGFGENSGIPGLAADQFPLWDSVGGQPIPAEIGGKAAFLGRIRVMPSDELYFLLGDAQSGAVLQRLGPYGTYNDGYRHTHAAIAGTRAAISDFQAKLHLVDLESGAEAKVLDLSDRAELVCAAADGSTFWIRQVDKRELLVDPKGGELREGERPEGCVDATEEAWPLIPSGPQRKALARVDKKIEGFESERILEEGELRVAAGHKHPGTAIPQAVGLDRDDGLRWRVDVPTIDPMRARERSNEHDALAAGRYVTIYGEGSKAWHVTAIDAATGDRLWDVPLRVIFAVDSIDGVVATDRHVFVTRTSSLEILDATSGALLATIGRESYED